MEYVGIKIQFWEMYYVICYNEESSYWFYLYYQQ